LSTFFHYSENSGKGEQKTPAVARIAGRTGCQWSST